MNHVTRDQRKCMKIRANPGIKQTFLEYICINFKALYIPHSSIIEFVFHKRRQCATIIITNKWRILVSQLSSDLENYQNNSACFASVSGTQLISC